MSSFCTHLDEFGWTPTILTTFPPGAEQSDCNRADASSPWTVHRVGPGDQGWLNLAAALLSVPGKLFGKTREDLFAALAWRARSRRTFPDAGTYCNRYISPLTRRIKQLCRQESFDAMLITAPPHSMILLAGRLGSCPLPVVLDIRDPWTGGFDYALQGRPDRRARRLEARAVANAAAVTCVTPLQTHHLQQAYPAHAAKIRTVWNMYAPQLGVPTPPPDPAGPFDIVLLGDTYDNPADLLDAVRLVHDEGMNVHLHWIGHTVTDPSPWQDLIAAGTLSLTPRLPRSEALARAARADAFWLDVPMTDRADYVIRSKVYDYLAIGRFIIGTAPQPAAIRDLLDSLCRYELIASRESAEIASLIERTIRTFQAGQLNTQIDRAKLDELSPRNQTRRLVELLGEIAP